MGPTIAQKFVDAKVAGVVGHLNSGVTIPASAVYNQAGIPMISGSATNPKLTEQGFKTIFRTVGRDDQQGPAIAAYLAGELKVKKVAIADDATAYGEGLANEVEKTLKARRRPGRRAREDHRQGDRLQGDPDQDEGQEPRRRLLRRHGRHRRPDAQAGARTRHQGGVRFGDGACTDEMAKLAGAAAEGLICSQAGLPREAASKEFNDAFKAKYGDVKQYAPFFYDARRPDDRGDAEGRLDRPGQVPARSCRRSATTARPARSSSTRRATARTPRSRSSR